MALRRRPLIGKGGDSSPPKPLRKLKAPAMSAELQGVLAQVKKKDTSTVQIASQAKDHGRIRTGILALDLALGGGFKLSRCHMLYGEKSTGKSTIAALLVASLQRKFPNQYVAWIDIEGTFDKVWAKRLGVDLDRLLISEPSSGEEAVDIADGLIRTPDICGIVVDSIAALTPTKEIEASAADHLMGVHAKLIGTFLRKVNQAMISGRKHGRYPVVLHLNQFRSKIGVVFGDPRVLPGGKALEFFTSQQVQTYNKEHKLDKGPDAGLVVYNEHSFVVTKDKTGGRLKEGKFKLIRDESQGFPVGFIDQAKTIISFATTAGLYKGAGASHNFDGLVIKGSHEDVSRFFLENPEEYDKIQEKIIQYYVDLWGLE